MKFDQHFLINEGIAKQIVSYLNVKENESVLEIGPGKGILSKYLDKADLVELDKDLCEKLRNKFSNYKIINKNILKIKINYDKIIGNIPYSISEPLLNKLMNSNFKLCILTIPEKFLEKGLLKLIIPNFLEIKTLMKIDKKEFSPVPRVNSKVIQIKKKELKHISEDSKEFKKQLSEDKKLKSQILKGKRK